MTPKEKNILLKDLCARLPYGVKVQCDRYPRPVTVLYAGNINEVKFAETGGIEHIESIKPYLRSMSTMSIDEEQREAYLKDWGSPIDYIDFCLSRHLDFRGLIEQGLAIEAQPDMYIIEK